MNGAEPATRLVAGKGAVHTVTRGFRDDERPAVAALYWQAFGGKLAFVFGPSGRATDYIARCADPRHALVARASGGAMIGIAGFKSASGGLVRGGYRDIRRSYGAAGAVWRIAIMRMLMLEVDYTRFLIDGIAVEPDQRNRGIGTALVAALCAEAQQQGYREIRLDVATENLRARALYERLGFSVRRTDKSRTAAMFFGFSGSPVMVRSLPQASVEGTGSPA